MNIRAERIDQMIQLLNRNLLLISAGQLDDNLPLSLRSTQKIEAGVFGFDKFANDMISYVQSSKKANVNDLTVISPITSLWEKHFITGLEALLVECSTVRDEIERECFVSRIYRWFTEKISEKRDLPNNKNHHVEYNSLKDSVISLGGNGTHSVKALELYHESFMKANEGINPATLGKSILLSENNKPIQDTDVEAELINSKAMVDLSNTYNKSRTLKKMKQIQEHKQLFPSILPRIFTNDLLLLDSKDDITSKKTLHEMRQSLKSESTDDELLLKSSLKHGTKHGIKTREGNANTVNILNKLNDNYGMVHHIPESEEEITMHELWIAKRKQEIFDSRSQQQINLVMDRLAMNKSRHESDVLRRTESNSMIFETSLAEKKFYESQINSNLNNFSYAQPTISSSMAITEPQAADPSNLVRFAPKTHRLLSSHNKHSLQAQKDTSYVTSAIFNYPSYGTTSDINNDIENEDDDEENINGNQFEESRDKFNVSKNGKRVGIIRNISRGLENDKGQEDDAETEQDKELDIENSKPYVIKISGGGKEMEVTIPRNVRKIINKPIVSPSQSNHFPSIPMRFSNNKLPDSFSRSNSRQDSSGSGRVNSLSNIGVTVGVLGGPMSTQIVQGDSTNNYDLSNHENVIDESPKSKYVEAKRSLTYMQLSDSDDDDKPDRNYIYTNNITHSRPFSAPAAKTSSKVMAVKSLTDIQLPDGPPAVVKKKPAAKSKAKAPSMILFKHVPPVVRERSLASQSFRSLALDDPELKIHYRHSNYRRMPFTVEQEMWLDDKERERVKKSFELSKKLFEAKLASKKSKKDKKKDKEKNKKNKNKKIDKKKAKVMQVPPTSKYRDAAHFMSVKFPNFDDSDTLTNLDNNERYLEYGPMRAAQLMECSEIMSAFNKKNLSIDENVLKRALLIPQDAPEAICLENMQTPINDGGLMVNPNPVELWRKMKLSKKKGKKRSKRR